MSDVDVENRGRGRTVLGGKIRSGRSGGHTGSHGIGMAPLWLVATIVVVAFVALPPPSKSTLGGGSATTLTPSDTRESLPPGGLAESGAVSLARGHVPPDSRFVEARAGRFEDVYQSRAVGPDDPAKPTDLVWAVEFSREFVLCPPDGSPCESPRPGTTTVILDYLSGEYRATYSYSPAN